MDDRLSILACQRTRLLARIRSHMVDPQRRNPLRLRRRFPQSLDTSGLQQKLALKSCWIDHTSTSFRLSSRRSAVKESFVDGFAIFECDDAKVLLSRLDIPPHLVFAVTLLAHLDRASKDFHAPFWPNLRSIEH